MLEQGKNGVNLVWSMGGVWGFGVNLAKNRVGVLGIGVEIVQDCASAPGIIEGDRIIARMAMWEGGWEVSQSVR